MKSVSFSDITFSYNGKQKIFSHLSFNFSTKTEGKGHIIALMGTSGSGKSTLLNLTLQTLKANQGFVKAEPMSPLISYIPQEPILFEHLSPEGNARYLSKLSFYKRHFQEARFRALSKALGMEEVFQRSKHVNQLSGGQRQRLMLLRALSVNPDILLLDEPTNGLDSEVKVQFLSQLRSLVVDQNILAIYVTHHKTEAEFIADEVAFLNTNGQGGISEILHAKLTDFVETPPILDSAKIFRYPTPNVLMGLLHGPNSFSILEKEAEGCCYAVIQPSSFVFSKDYGVEFMLLSTNPMVSIIAIGTQQVTVETSSAIFQDGMKVSMTGEVLIYSHDKKFLRKQTLIPNSITKQ